MDFNNFIKRIFISLILLFSYLIIVLNFYKYLSIFIILLFILIFIEIFFYFKKKKLLIIIYLFLSLFSLLFIEFNEENFFIFNLMILVIVTFDIFSYFVGSLIGKNKILLNISPKKTFEGLLGGIIFSFFSALIYLNTLGLNIDLTIIFFILSTIIAAFFGDLLESKFKRINSLKNSSDILPGHGGLFDRFDSFILSLIIYSFFINFI